MRPYETQYLESVLYTFSILNRHFEFLGENVNDACIFLLLCRLRLYCETHPSACKWGFFNTEKNWYLLSVRHLPPENAYYHSNQCVANNDEKCIQILHKSIFSMTGTQIQMGTILVKI